MTPLDSAKIVPGARVLLADGAVTGVKGCYLSPSGLVLMCGEPGQAVARNVPISLVVGVEEETK